MKVNGTHPLEELAPDTASAPVHETNPLVTFLLVLAATLGLLVIGALLGAIIVITALGDAQ